MAAQRTKREAREDRELRTAVSRLSGCLAALPAQSQRVLRLRTGIGAGRAYSRGAVAHILRVSMVREDVLEQTALIDLRGVARSDGCAGAGASTVFAGGSSDTGMLAALPQLGSFAPGSGTSGAASPTGHAPSAVAAHRGQASPNRGEIIYNASVAALPATSSNSSTLVLIALLALAGLGAVLLVGRRLRQRPEMAPEMAHYRVGPALPVDRTFAPRPRRAWSPEANGSGATASDAPRISPAPAPTSPPGAGHTPASARTPAPATPTPWSRTRGPQPEPAQTAAAPSEPNGGPTVPDGNWLRAHRSQVALVVTAVGGALRLLARGRGSGAGRRRRGR